MRDKPPTREELLGALKRVAPMIVREIPDRRLRLNVLAHVVAADLKAEGESPEGVVGYLTKITGMLDGKFDR